MTELRKQAGLQRLRVSWLFGIITLGDGIQPLSVEHTPADAATRRIGDGEYPNAKRY